ncbi:MAG: hypothetical protein AAF928_18375 [Myxococcota bacterium]
MGTRYLVGADENGLGPRLGPMTVTAVLARVTDEAVPLIRRRPRGGMRKRLGDSKGLVAHGNCALGEAWTRALVERGAGRQTLERPRTPAELLGAVSLDPTDVLTSPCPRHVRRQCWSVAHEDFVPAAQMGSLLRDVRGDLQRLAARGIDIVAVRSVIVCTKRLNQAFARGASRFVVDLHAMERLILHHRELAGVDISAECGKVGGFGQYGKVFGPLGGRLHLVLEEGRARSAYRFPGVGDIAFVRDGDASNILVGMASLVGKYLRELLMGRIVDHYRRLDASLPVVSGYHDPVTTKFIVATEALRRRRRVPATCFERAKRTPSA